MQDLALLPGRGLPVSMRIHEPLELLAIPGVAEIFHEFREFALGGDELRVAGISPAVICRACACGGQQDGEDRLGAAR